MMATQNPNMGFAYNLSRYNPPTNLSVGCNPLKTFQTPNTGLGQNTIRTNLTSLHISLRVAQILSVPAGYSQKKKDSVQAVLIQRYADYPDYIGLAQRLPNSIGSVQRLPDDIGLVPAILTAEVCTKPTILAQSGCSHMTIPSAGGRDLNHVNDVHEVDCLVLRFSDLSFFSQASITHDEKLEFSDSTLALISSINSCGKRIPLYCDLLFLCLVAIEIIRSKCFNTFKNTVNIFSVEVFKQKCLDAFKCIEVTYLNTLIVNIKKKQSPISAVNTNGASDHNVKRGNTMAMYKSTQTHPKFKWRFFSCQQSRYFTVEARSEQEARSMLPDAPCLFSARFRQGVNHA